MLVRGVVDYKIENDANPLRLRPGLQMIKIVQSSIHRIDVLEVRDIVAKIDLRRGIERRDPNGVHTQAFQVVEFGRDPCQVAGAAIVAIGKAPRIEFVKDRVFPPWVALGVDSLGMA